MFPSPAYLYATSNVAWQWIYTHPFLLFTFLVTCKLLSTRYSRGLREIPGPLLASFTNLWRFNVVRREDMPWTSIRLHEELGPLVRMGPNHVSVTHPDALRIIYGPDNTFQKSVFYRTAQARYEGRVLSNMFSTHDNSYHSRIKRATGNIYSTSAILELEPLINSCVNLFITRLREFEHPEPKPFNVSAWLQFYSFDCLGAISFSQPIGCLSTGTDIDSMIRAVDRIFDYVALVGQMPFWDKLLLGNPLLHLLMPAVQSSGGILNFAINKVHSYRDKPTDKKDILSRLYKIHQTNPEKLNFTEVVGAISINVFAGHDALAITMRAVLYYLCKNPEACRKVKEEIRLADASGKLSNPISYTEATNLPYLSAVITETTRIHPPVGLILERQVPPGGALICGIHIPENTIVGINAWVLHRNKSIFGKDVEEFRPERWIDCNLDQLNVMRRNIFTFGAGPRACVGRSIALIEIFKLMGEILRRFDFELADPTKEWHVQGTWVTKQTEMDMIFRERIST